MSANDCYSLSHADLVLRAEKWLNNAGCKVVFREFVTRVSEQPDAIGWRDGRSIMIECKSTRADFLSDKKKWFRKNPENGVGDWRFYMCPPEIIKPDDLPEHWGLLWVYPKTVKRVHGVPKGNTNWYSAPFEGHKTNENIMLVSALRRLQIRGYLPLIYQPIEEIFTSKENSTAHLGTTTER